MKRFATAAALTLGMIAGAWLVRVSLTALTELPVLHAQMAAPVQGPEWDCALDGIGATTTLCKAAPQPGLALYITDIVAQSTTATGGQFTVRTGTSVASGGSANCGTAVAALFPGASGANVRLGAAGNTSAPTIISPNTPIRVPPGLDLCVIGVVTNTLVIHMTGYIAAP